MGADEEGTPVRLKAIRKTLVDPLSRPVETASSRQRATGKTLLRDVN
jgi:hypothetical protein